MSKLAEYRQAAIEARFPRREFLSHAELAGRYFADLPRDGVLACLERFEEEYDLKIGFVRPDDSLFALMAPVSTMNPLRWLQIRGRESDGHAQLVSALRKSRAKRGLDTDFRSLRSFGDYVRAWAVP